MDGQDLGSAIKQIKTMTEETLRTSVLDVPLERKGVYLLVGPDGTAKKHVSDPGWHVETLETPAELVNFIQKNAKVVKESAEGAVYYNEKKIVFVYDQTDRRDRAFCDLRISPQFAWLYTQGTAGGSGTLLSQADMVRLLRILFRGCLGNDSQLLPLVRQLKFKASAEADGDIQHGRESMGRSLLAAVAGRDAIPEEICFEVPVFENHPFKTKVWCALEILVQEERFRLTPYPLEIKNAIDSAMSDIAFTFTNKGVPPIYRGSVEGK